MITLCFRVSSNLSQQKSPTAEQLFGENICLEFPLLGSFLVINLKKPQSRKWSTCQSFKKITLERSVFWSTSQNSPTKKLFDKHTFLQKLGLIIEIFAISKFLNFPMLAYEHFEFCVLPALHYSDKKDCTFWALRNVLSNGLLGGFLIFHHHNRLV